MDRRRFLIAAAGAALAGCNRIGDEADSFLRGLGLREPAPVVLRPGMAEGHALRDMRAWPEPVGELHTDVAILGSGAGGLSAAWQLSRAGHRHFIMLEGPEYGGNAAGGRFGDISFPRGAHYLPLPSTQSDHVREMLYDMGVIERDPFGIRPRFDERVVVHAPDERLFFDGKWQDGLMPEHGDHDDQHTRFLARMDALRHATGNDGRGVRDPDRRIVARSRMDCTRSADVQAMAESRRLHRADVALVCRLLLSRRLRRGRRYCVRVGGPALFCKPRRARRQRRRWRSADVAGWIARHGDAAGGEDRCAHGWRPHMVPSRHGGTRR